MLRKQIIVITVIFAGIIACKKTVEADVFKGFKKQPYFPEPAYHFDTNPVTKAGFELGRKLFYETMLSADSTISCASCHIQTAAFTHHGHAQSHGIYDRLGTRNSPPIMNLAWSSTYMWDGGIADLDLQPVAPITNPVEMDATMDMVLKRLKAQPAYVSMFQQAFSTDVTTASFLKALSQFMVMCVSDNSKYDQVMRNETSFTAQEKEGYNLFKQHCNSCHKEPLFTDFSFRNNGLSPSMINDKGRYLITLRQVDAYTFKVPTLRNLIYTAPYMHDGRFFELDAVLDHYTSGIAQIENLDPLLKNGLLLSATDKASLLAFLKTLTDKTMLLNTQLSQP